MSPTPWPATLAAVPPGAVRRYHRTDGLRVVVERTDTAYRVSTVSLDGTQTSRGGLYLGEAAGVLAWLSRRMPMWEDRS